MAFLFLLLTTVQAQTSGSCFGEPFPNTFINGETSSSGNTVYGTDIHSPSAAKAACLLDSECTGITYSPGWGWTLRSGETLTYASTGELSYQRVDCGNNCFAEVAQPGFINGETSVGDTVYGTDPDNAEEAKGACNWNSECTGVTWSPDWGWTLRSGEEVTYSPTGEKAFLKIACGNNCWSATQFNQFINGETTEYTNTKFGEDVNDATLAKGKCMATASCTGITFSPGYGWTLRSGSTLSASPSSETSYTKVACVCDGSASGIVAYNSFEECGYFCCASSDAWYTWGSVNKTC